MKFSNFFAAALFFAVVSCTLDKTDYEDEISGEVPVYYEFKEALSVNSGIYKVSVEALNGTFYKGYNEIRLTITDTQTDKQLSAAEVTFLPVMTNAGGTVASCPHSYNFKYDSENGYYTGYIVFTSVITELGYRHSIDVRFSSFVFTERTRLYDRLDIDRFGKVYCNGHRLE